MKFAEFLDFIKNLNQLPEFPNLLFTNYTQSSMFAVLFISLLKGKFANSCISIDISQNSLSEIKKNLEVSFLGNKYIYFIKNFIELDDKQKKEFYSYIDKYSGTHSVILFDSKTNLTSDTIKSIELPDNIDFDIYTKLSSVFLPQVQSNIAFAQKYFESNQSVSLDLACQLIKYQTVLGKNTESFFNLWLDKIDPQDKSLFDLSQAFFSQDLNNFLRLWVKIKDDYPPEFWVSYFSDQIWQANLFILRAKKFGIIEAKKKARLLPFLFMNKLWQNFTPEYLSRVHNNLYIFDFNLKNGLAENIEIWLYKFILNQN